MWCGKMGHFARECRSEIDIFGVKKGKNPRYGEKPKNKDNKNGVRMVTEEEPEAGQESDDEEPAHIRNVQPDVLFAVDDGNFDAWYEQEGTDPWAISRYGHING